MEHTHKGLAATLRVAVQRKVQRHCTIGNMLNIQPIYSLYTPYIQPKAYIQPIAYAQPIAYIPPSHPDTLTDRLTDTHTDAPTFK